MKHNKTESAEELLSGKKLKAFTLVELIIVIAVIAVLAAIMTVFVPGFVKQANIETNNKTAQVIYTAMQDCLIQWEIKQMNDCVDVDKYAATPSFSGKPVTYSIMGFYFTYGKISSIVNVTSVYDNDISQNVSFSLNATSTNEDVAAAHKKFAVQFLNSLSSSFEGRVWVYIDYENYTVDSVVYTPSLSGEFLAEEMYWSSEPLSPSQGKIFSGCSTYNQQKALYDMSTTRVGYYPITEDVEACSVYSNLVTMGS